LLPDKHGKIDQAACAGTKSAAAGLATHQSAKTGNRVMSDAQIGLLTATPIIMLFAVALRRMGVLSTAAMVSAVGLSGAIVVVLFFTQ
jgi:hypothetical protein